MADLDVARLLRHVVSGVQPEMNGLESELRILHYCEPGSRIPA